jgi:hypothetical protein
MGKRVGAMPAEVNSVAFNSGKEKKKEEEYKKDKRNKRKLTLQRDRKEKGKMGKSIRETLGEEREEENEDQDEDIIMTSSYFSSSPPLPPFPSSLSFHQRPEEIIGLKDTEAAPCRYHAHTLPATLKCTATLSACHINSHSLASPVFSLPALSDSPPPSQSIYNKCRNSHEKITTQNKFNTSDNLVVFFFLPSMAKMSRSSWSSRTNRRSKSSSFSLESNKSNVRDNINQPLVYVCHQTCNHY